MVRRSIIAACVLLCLVLVLAALWSIFDWPPPRLILKYGFPPTGGPTGRTMTIEGVEFVELKPGYFRMGSHFLCEEGDLLGIGCAVLHLPWGKQPKHDSNECPPHWVEIQVPIWCARTEVTNEQYERFDSAHDRVIDSASAAATHLTWEDARAYCEWLSKRGGVTVRLPSEAEWEYACRAGSTTEYCFGDDAAELPMYARIGREGLSGPGPVPDLHEVRTRRANAWGLYDLHGNVGEYCEDTFHSDYNGAPEDEQAWTQGGELDFLDTTLYRRPIRGGSVFYGAPYSRSAHRGAASPLRGWWMTGFRPVATAP